MKHQENKKRSVVIDERCGKYINSTIASFLLFICVGGKVNLCLDSFIILSLLFHKSVRRKLSNPVR